MEKWSPEKARDWYAKQPWPCGFNYLPSSAVNSTEMWQADTYDAQTIDRELAWAAELGMNCCRVFLQHIVWDNDPQGMLDRMDRFLAAADAHGIRTAPILFDDCAFSGKQPYLGPQDDPVPGVHNSGWTASPGREPVEDKAAWPRLQEYVETIVGRFAQDDRVLLWDLYNEPGNSEMGNKSLPLMREAFEWARNAKPAQPLTVGLFSPELHDINAATLELSDIVTFHCYEPLEVLKRGLDDLAMRDQNRPILCTEWMARTRGSLFSTHLPYLKQEKIGSMSWGLVQGKTQTHYPWGSPKNAPQPNPWFHDILHTNGTPYDAEETELIRAIARR